MSLSLFLSRRHPNYHRIHERFSSSPHSLSSLFVPTDRSRSGSSSDYHYRNTDVHSDAEDIRKGEPEGGRRGGDSMDKRKVTLLPVNDRGRSATTSSTETFVSPLLDAFCIKGALLSIYVYIRISLCFP